MPSLKNYSHWNPFDYYDFFGYLFPGIFFASSVLLFIQLSITNIFSHFEIVGELYKTSPFLTGVMVIVTVAGSDTCPASSSTVYWNVSDVFSKPL